MRFLKYILATAFIATSLNGQSLPVQTDYVEAQLIPEVTTVQPGTPFWLALRMTMKPDWHSYWRNPGDAGLPTEITWTAPEGFSFGEIQWPYPERVSTEGLVSYGYSNTIFLLVRATPPASLKPGTDLALKADTQFLVCKDVCLRGEATLELTIPVGAQVPQPDTDWAEAFAETREALPITASDWQIQAFRQDTTLIIAARPPSGYDGSLQDLQFMPFEEEIVENSIEPVVSAAASGTQLQFRVSSYRETPLDSISGLLVSAAGWRGPGSERALEFRVPVQEGFPAAASGDNSLALALLFSFIGGMILNLMPCVLPVLSIKILGFVNQAKAHAWQHGAAYTIGVLVAFWILAGSLIALRAGGEQLGWGFQLQSPIFIIVLSTIIFLFGLSLFGVFEIGTGLMNAGSKLDGRSGLGGAFWSGIAATVVATPCTAPFMGSALGFALTQPAIVALLVFTFLGLGMAFPFAILTVMPALAGLVPKPGRWMESFKQFMGFLMMATVVWLAWVFGRQSGVDALAVLLLSLLTAGLGAWIYGRWGTPVMSRGMRWLAMALALILAIGGMGVAISASQSLAAAPASHSDHDTDGLAWQKWTPERLQELLANGKPVFVDFTADWCLSCKVNERIVLADTDVIARFQELGIVALKADWTSRDPEITKALAGYGRNSVPLYVLYAASENKPVLLPEILTTGIMLDALKPMSAASGDE